MAKLPYNTSSDKGFQIRRRKLENLIGEAGAIWQGFFYCHYCKVQRGTPEGAQERKKAQNTVFLDLSSYPARTRTGATNTGFLAIVDSETANNTALIFPSLEQLSLVLLESLSEETLKSLRGLLRG